MKIGKHVTRTIAFLLVLAFAVFIVQGPFGIDRVRSYRNAKGFFIQPRDSLDGVFIGASNVHAFWQAAFGWHDRGIAIYNLSFDSLPITAVQYLVEEARKTQPNALYLICLNTFKRQTTATDVSRIHGVVDYMPLSVNKLRYIHYVADRSSLGPLERLELYLPIIRFHSRWDELESWAFGSGMNRYMNAMTTSAFSNESVDITDDYAVYDTRAEAPEDVVGQFEALLDYLDREHVNALFVKVPQAEIKSRQGRMNALEDLLKARGYPCLDMLSVIDEIGIDTRHDFYNKAHTNVYGSLKICHYMMDYLEEHYSFADKRGQAAFADWDIAAEAYDRLVDGWILPFDRERAPWTPLKASGQKATVVDGADGPSVRLTWKASAGAEGYVVYRKNSGKNNGRWILAATVGADDLSYVDRDVTYGGQYKYCVAPFADLEGVRAYGDYQIKGASVRITREEAPVATDESSAGGDED